MKRGGRLRFGLGVALATLVNAGGGGVSLTTLTIGTATLRSEMVTGDVVALILGKTPGSIVVMTGAAFDSGRLDVSPDGTAIVVGSAGPGAGGTTTGTYSLVESLAGASNSPRTSGPFASLTTVQDWYAVNNNGTGYSRTAVTDVEPSTGIHQFIMFNYIRPDAIPAATRTVFGLLHSDAVSPTPRCRISNTGTVFYMAKDNADVVRAGVSEIGRWSLFGGQINATNGHGTGVNDRARGGKDGVLWAGTAPALSVAGNVPDAAFNGYETATGTSVAAMRHGFHWVWWGTTAECGRIDFNDPATWAAFAPIIGGLNPANGTVTLPLIGGGTVTLTPKAFYHGDATSWQNGTIANRGTAGAGLVMPRVAGTYSATDFSGGILYNFDGALVTQTTFTSLQGASLTFASPVTGKQTRNGDWIISNPTGVPFVDAPLSVQGTRPYTGGTTPALWYHGMQLNIGRIADGAGEGPSAQGVDGWRGTVAERNLAYNHGMNVSKGATGNDLTLTSGTLYKQVSRTSSVPANGDSTALSISRFNIVDYALTAGRTDSPPHALADKTWITPLEDLNIDISAFPNLSAVTGAPSSFEVYELLRSPHSIGHLNHNLTASMGCSAQERKYGRDMAEIVGKAGLLLCLASTTAAQKRGLLGAIHQHAKEITALWELGRVSTADGLGGTSQGRKLLLALAAVATGDARIVAASQATDPFGQSGTDGWLPEQRQITTIVTGDTTRPSAPYAPALIGRGEWTSSPVGDRSTYPIPHWTTAQGGGVQYRHLWSVTMFSHYCVMRAVPAVRTQLNWAAFEDYMRRYWDTEFANGFQGEGQTYRLTTYFPFAYNFRTTHTSLFP